MQKTVQYIKQALATFYIDSEVTSLSRLIMEYATGLSMPLIMCDRSRKIGDEQRKLVEAIVEKLKGYEPIQYILGETEFYGFQFDVNRKVLIPRPETEELIELIVNRASNAPVSILDIGTGSGCIAISLAKLLPNATLAAWDISNEALDVAKGNAIKNRVEIDFRQVDVLNNCPHDKMYDIVVSNPPYVLESEKSEMEANVLEYEPHLALFVPDEDPLLYYKHIAILAKKILTPGGLLYFEINANKADDTIALLQQNGFDNIKLHQDLSRKDRMIVAEHNHIEKNNT